MQARAGGEALPRGVRLKREELSVLALTGSSANNVLLDHTRCSGKVDKSLMVRGSNSRNLLGGFEGSLLSQLRKSRVGLVRVCELRASRPWAFFFCAF